jgi:dienelactone hydrolase
MKKRCDLSLIFTLAIGLCSCAESAQDSGMGSGDGSGSVDGSGSGEGSGTVAFDFAAPGPFRVGVRSLPLSDATRSRAWSAEVWYPTVAEGSASAVLDFATNAEERTLLEELYPASPEGCATRSTKAIRDAAPADGGPLPVIFFSHCHGCTRFELFTVAEQLASYGFAVVAPDHTGNTLFSHRLGTPAPINAAFLDIRVEDMLFTAAAAFDEAGPFAAAGLRFDAARVGVMGHSFGAATAAWTGERLSGVKAVAALAAPMESPLLPGPTMAALPLPTLFLLAREDNSITELGNRFIRNNHGAAASPSWLVELADAGHWSPSDLCGLTTEFAAGCGDGRRMTGRAPFTYVEGGAARRTTAALVTAFFASVLTADARGLSYLNAGRFDLETTLSKR